MPDTERSYSGKVVAAIIFAAMVAGAIYRYWPSDERSIRRHLSNLAEALSIPSTDSVEERLTRFAVLREYFSPDVRIRLEDREIASRDPLIAELSQWKPPPGGLAVEFVDITVAVAEDKGSARVTLTAKASTTDSTGTSTVDERAADVLMVKRDGDWVISSATLRSRSTLLHRRNPASNCCAAHTRDGGGNRISTPARVPRWGPRFWRDLSVIPAGLSISADLRRFLALSKRFPD